MIQAGQVCVALIHTVLGLFVLRGRPESSVNRAFAAQSLLFAGWVLGLSGLHDPRTVRESFALTFAFASLIPVGFVIFSFSYCYPASSPWSSPLHVRAIFVAGSVFAALSIGTEFVLYDAIVSDAGLTRKPGQLYPAFAIYFIVVWCAALGIFVRKWRTSRGLARAQYQYLGAGLIGGSIGGISTNLLVPWLTGQSTYSWVGPFFTLVYVGFVAHAIIRHRLMDLRLFIHRGLTICLASVFSAIPVCVLLAVFWPRLLISLHSFELAFLLTTIAIVTVLIPITRDVAGRLLDRYVYRTHANYQRTIREASQVLTQVLHLEKLLAFIVTTVVRSTGAAGAAIYLREDRIFRCARAQTGGHVGNFETQADAPPQVITALEAAQGPILTDELARERDPAAVSLHEQLLKTQWALLLPVFSEEALIAVVVVGPKLSGDSFYQHDLDLLATLANQAGIAIKNAQLYAAIVVANEYLENIVATVETGVVAINAAGQIAIFNRAAAQLTGISKDITEVGMLPSCLSESLVATVNDGQPRTRPEVELPTAALLHSAPTVRPVICITSPVRDPAGAVLGAVAVFSDLTPLKELEVGRRNAERLVYFQTLASGIAHEIKNPLVAIKTFTQLLPRRREDPRFLDEFGRISIREIERMQRIVDRLSALSRPTSGTHEVIDLRDPAHDAIEFIQPTLEEKGLTLSTSLAAEPCMIVGNAGEMEQLFLNLLLNAYDATPGGGSVTVRVATAESQVVVTISDSGCGIPPELLEKIFEPFFTTKPRGSGLGLAVSASIVQMHGGRIRAANDAAGATFIVEFPGAEPTPVAIA
jgi:signal transduction histidine kinase